jgi:hypothetical protein
MARKKKEIPREKTWVSPKRLAAISMILIVIVASCLIVFFLFLQPEVPFSLKAAIIDQLGEEFPNPTFVANVTALLQNYSFTVTYHNSSLDVDFFNALASHNYGIIILRVHSALREDNSTVDLFTTEKYASGEYQWYRDHGLVVVGRYLYRPEEYYYAVTSLFIRDLEGHFPKSIVIAMGCWSLKPGCEQMAMAYINKGAKAYIGWTDIVLPEDTDNETFRLLQMLLNENRTLADAVSRTNGYIYHGDNQTIYSHMRFYPSSEENLTISKLITEAKVSSSLTAFDSEKNFSNFLIANTIRKPKGFTWKN